MNIINRRMAKNCPMPNFPLNRHFNTLTFGKIYFFSKYLSKSFGIKVTFSKPSVLPLILHLHITLSVVSS